MKIQLKKYLNKHKNRIFSLIAVMVFIPMFSFNAFAYEKEYLSYPYGYPEKDNSNVYWGTNLTEIYNRQNMMNNIHDNLYIQIWSSGIRTDWSSFFVGDSLLSTVYPYDNERFEYKVVGHFFVDGNNNNFNINTLDISDIKVYEYEPFNSNAGSKSASNLIINTNYTFDTVNFNFTFDLLEYSNLSVLEFVFNEPLVFTNRNSSAIGFTLSVVAVPKGTNEDELNAIISAINNQTSTLAGKIDDTNDFIDKGNSSTGGIVSDNNSAVDNLNEVVSEYYATEQQFFDDFTANQQAINSDIVGWSWGGLVNCANWVGETMTDYYNNMGDFRQYIIYPLMLGIVLFFLGRGGAIIGHLFRKPTQSTVNIESTSFKRGNTRYTTTTTSRKGGVFRK